MSYINAKGISLILFPDLADRYLHPICEDLSRFLIATMEYQQKFCNTDVTLIPLNINKMALLVDAIVITTYRGNLNCLLKMCYKHNMLTQHGNHDINLEIFCI